MNTLLDVLPWSLLSGGKLAACILVPSLWLSNRLRMNCDDTYKATTVGTDEKDSLHIHNYCGSLHGRFSRGLATFNHPEDHPLQTKVLEL